jgi:hypothetical protein
MMGKEKLKYISHEVLEELRSSIPSHRELYLEGDFADLAKTNGWCIEAETVTVDYDLIRTLDGKGRNARGDIEASKIVYKSLDGMTPALAREERILVRLAHVECLNYSRNRWLSGASEEDLDGLVETHMFAKGLLGSRDDNSIGRLWWNMHVATMVDPHDPEKALEFILKTTDIRSGFVERSRTASRVPLARAIYRLMQNDPWVSSSAQPYREFMKTLNLIGAGLLFEVMTDSAIDAILEKCVTVAKDNLAEKVSSVVRSARKAAGSLH